MLPSEHRLDRSREDHALYSVRRAERDREREGERERVACEVVLSRPDKMSAWLACLLGELCSFRKPLCRSNGNVYTAMSPPDSSFPNASDPLQICTKHSALYLLIADDTLLSVASPPSSLCS